MKIEKGKKAKDYCKKLLQDSKHGQGPCTSTEEKAAFIGKTGMAYYAHTHKAENFLTI